MRENFGYRTTREITDRAEMPAEPVVKDAIPFQPDAVEVQLRALPRAARVALWSMTILLILAIAWSAWAKVDRTVTATGRLISQSRTIVQQPFQSSVIRSLNYRAGELVEEGDVIATLDQTVTSVDVEQQRAQLVIRQAEMARIDAELSGTEMAPEGLPQAYAMQAELLDRRRAEFTLTFERFAARRLVLEAQYRIAQSQYAQIGAQLELARQRLVSTTRLAEENFSSQVNLLERQTEVTRLEAAMQEKTEEQERYIAELTVLEREEALYQSERERALNDRRVALANDIDQLEIQIQRAERVSALLTFRAPADGILLEVTSKSVGSVVEPAEVLFTLVPLDEGLDLEIEVAARDAGWIHVGQPVRIKLDPFPFQRHGTLLGEIAAISPDSLRRQVGGQTVVYFRVRVAIIENNLRNLPDNFVLTPGITAAAEVQIAPRTVLSYLTDPIHRALDESLNEPN